MSRREFLVEANAAALLDIGTPLGAILPWLNLGQAGLAGAEAALGMILIALTLAHEGCI